MYFIDECHTPTIKPSFTPLQENQISVETISFPEPHYIVNIIHKLETLAGAKTHTMNHGCSEAICVESINLKLGTTG